MGRLLMVLCLVAALAAGCFFFVSDTADGFSLMPSFMLTEKEAQLRSLSARFKSVKQRYAQANRTAAVAGLDTTADIEAARARTRAIRQELEELNLVAGRGAASAAALKASLEAFSHDLS